MIQKDDINSQIDRILSCNIKDQLLNHIPIQMLQSPAIQKKYFREDTSSAKSKQAFQKQFFQEDLLEKAEQIMKLKQTLEAELSHINQIVEDNQKLTEANLYLTQELKKIKNEWKMFKNKVKQELTEQKQNHWKTQAKILQTLKEKNLINKNKASKLSIITSFEIKNDLKPFQFNRINNNQSLKINPQQIVFNINSNKSNVLSIMTQTQVSSSQIERQIFSFQEKLQSLKNQNIKLQEQIKNLTKNLTVSHDKNISNQQIIKNTTPIECYTSVFLKTEFSQQENAEENIKSTLFSEQKPFFDSLKESKYLGNIILGKKNGSALQQYTNGFTYKGIFSKNLRHGMGKLYHKDKIVYTGEWKNGKFNGKGTLYYYLNLDIQKIQGNFKNGFIEGHSTITLDSGHRIRAFFKDNKILSSGMFLPLRKSHSNHFKNESYSGKIELKKVSQKQDKIIFITNAGETIQL